uniref:Uncharacterized protein n=1 Tax=Kalanchoe fedtschenkoi TaxID=63787 RepID=A0A7N0UA81_KALFE
MTEADAAGGIQVSEFDDSADNHVKAVEAISRVCGEPQIILFRDAEIERVGSSVTFLRQWRDYAYEPRAVNFSRETQRSRGGYATDGIKLPQFSAAAVPKETQSTSGSPNSRSDYILYCGGPVWGLDWCPQLCQNSSAYVNCEFLAVAAHPPGSSYHKLGAPLIGRGVIQIWCLLNGNANEGMEELSMGENHGKVRGRPLKKLKTESQNDMQGGSEHALPKRPVGRPRKQKAESQNDMGGGSEHAMSKRPIGRPKKHSANKSSEQKIARPRGRPRKQKVSEVVNDVDEHNEVMEYHPSMDVFVGDKSTSADSLRSAQNELLKSNKQKKKQNNMHTKSPNDAITSNSLNVLQDDNCNQNLVQYFMEQSPQPVPLDDVLMEQSTSGKSGESCQKTQTTLHSNDVCVDDFVASPAVDFSDDEFVVSLQLKRVKERSTQPIKTYMRRHKMARTEHLQYNGTVEVSLSQPQQSLTRIDDIDCIVSYDFETDTQGAQDEQQKNVSGELHFQKPQAGQPKILSEELHACSSAFQYERDHNFLRAKSIELSNEDDTNLSSSTQDTKHLSTATVDQGPLRNTTSNGRVVNSLNGVTIPTIPQDIALPRLVLCLAHNGKVAWDVKWRPNAHESNRKFRMGYLAVLLGNGSLEVWDVPLPTIVCDLFSSSRTEGTDPRFIKLKPVFKSSKLKFGDRESIPLTVEWSASFPHDLLLAGCHDGTVAVWKFSEGNPCEDTRPLLCFRADTAPIRAVSWAPVENDGEDAKVLVTAGHTGLKFWDMRDPFHPLWNLPLLRIYSLDWMPNPRCIVLSSDDGFLRLFGITEASNDESVTGKPFSGSKLQGLHTYTCSSCAIWNVHISRVTGMAAYCSADGTVVRFQLTTKGVEKDHSRNRTPHYLFGSVSENDSVLTVNTPPLNTPVQLKKPNAGPQSMRALLDVCNQPKPYHPQPMESASDDRALAIWNGNASGQDYHSQHMPSASAGNASDVRNGESSQFELAMECQTDAAKNTNEEDSVTSPPAKVLAMHRVRWNMNKGSERWLCWGGAAGIVRCQEMVFTDVDKMYYRNR